MANFNFSQVKNFLIPEGKVIKVELNNQIVWQAFTNHVPLSINSDGTIYNGTGYKDDYRIRSGGADQATSHNACTGFIKVSAGDIIRFSGIPWFEENSSGDAINVADVNFNNLGQFTMLQNAKYGIFESSWKTYAASSVVEEKTGVWRWIVPPAESGIEYIRISAFDIESFRTGKNMIVTINEEI